jgi:hypothetical protein
MPGEIMKFGVHAYGTATVLNRVHGGARVASAARTARNRA